MTWTTTVSPEVTWIVGPGYRPFTVYSSFVTQSGAWKSYTTAGTVDAEMEQGEQQEEQRVSFESESIIGITENVSALLHLYRGVAALIAEAKCKTGAVP